MGAESYGVFIDCHGIIPALPIFLKRPGIATVAQILDCPLEISKSEVIIPVNTNFLGATVPDTCFKIRFMEHSPEGTKHDWGDPTVFGVF